MPDIFSSANDGKSVHSCAMAQQFELVVAHYNENLAWLRRVPPSFRITVYHKGHDASRGEKLPNIGREAHTYMHHIAKQYEELADVTVFVQGHPFDHAPDLHARLLALAKGDEDVADFRWFGFVADTDDPRGKRLFVPWSKNTAGVELDLEGFHRSLFGSPGPGEYRFFVGAQFVVRRETAHLRSATFYSAACVLAADFPLAAHCFERCWDRVFMKDGTAGLLPAGQMTAYFKPLRRLANSTVGS